MQDRIGHIRTAHGIAVAALALVAIAAPPAAAAGAVDLDFRLAPGEDSGCRQWSPGGPAIWNLTLAMNGTDTSLVTTSTYVWINDSSAPAMRADRWIVILTASGDSASNPPSYDNAAANELAIGSGAFAPAAGAVDLPLYGGQHQPAAPVTNITLQITPSEDSENKDHNFTLVATTHRPGVPNVTREVHLCVHIPPKPRLESGALVPVLQAVADSDITVSFWVKNTGNTQDWYFCNVSVANDGWTWRFLQGINVGPNITNLTNIQQNITIRVEVHVPADARANENTTVSLECRSVKGLGVPYYPYYPYTRIELPQYYDVTARIAGDSTLCGIPGDIVVFQLEVTNKGNGPDHGVARVVPPSNLSWELHITPSEFDLAAHKDTGDTATAEFDVTIPLGARIFTFDFYLNITSSVPKTPIAQLRLHVCVKQVYDVQVTQPPPSYGVAQEVVFSFTIRNEGNGLDSLLIDTDVLPGWGLFLSPPIGEKLLQAGEEAALQATVVPPHNLRAGTYNQTVRVASKYAQLDLGLDVSQEANLTVIVGETCGVAIEPPVTRWSVDGAPSEEGSTPISFALTVRNVGNAPAEIAVELAGASAFFPTLSARSLTVDGFSVAVLSVKASVPRDAAAGNYTLTVNATPSCGADFHDAAAIYLTVTHAGTGASQIFTVRLGNVTFGPDDALQAGANIEAVERTNLTFTFTLHNSGNGIILAGTPVLVVYDLVGGCTFPEATGPCNSPVLETITLDQALLSGDSLAVIIHYRVPEVLAGAGGAGTASVNHTLRFAIPPGPYASTGDAVVIHLRAMDSPVPTLTTQPPATNPPGINDPVVVSNPGGGALAFAAGVGAVALVALLLARRRSQ
jgi:uncharacterized membrane protein